MQQHLIGESHSVGSSSLRPHGLYSPQNSPGQNTGMGILSLLQGIFPIQESNRGPLHYRRILYHLNHQGSQEYWSGYPIPSSADFSDPGIEPGYPPLQADSLPAEPPEKPKICFREFQVIKHGSVQFSSVAQSCPTLCDPMNHSMPGFPVHHQLLEFTQTRVHRVRDAIQPSHSLSSPSPPAPNPSQHQGLFQ